MTQVAFTLKAELARRGSKIPQVAEVFDLLAADICCACCLFACGGSGGTNSNADCPPPSSCDPSRET